MSKDVVEIIDGASSVLITCEHATERMPEGYDSLVGERILTAIRMGLDNSQGLDALGDSAAVTVSTDILWTTVLGNSEYPFSALEDLESSGRLRLLPDSIRSELSSLGQRLERFYFNTADLQVVQVERMDPMVIEFADAQRAIWEPDLGVEYRGRPDFSFFGKPRFRNVAMMKLVLTHTVMSRMYELLPAVRGLRAKILESIDG